jgi:hypothetical protein
MATPSADVLQERLDQIANTLDQVLEQAKRTNGRVDELEKWRDRLSGAWLILTLVSPIVAGLTVGLVLGNP